MNLQKKLLISMLLAAGLSLGAYVVFAQSISVPSFEVETFPYGPDINSFSVSPNPVGEESISVRFAMEAKDISGVKSASVQVVDVNGSVVGIVTLYDDGQHSDGVANDGVLANVWSLPNLVDGAYSINVQATDFLGNTTPEEGYIENFDVLAVGAGACLSDTDCVDSGFPQCCGGICREADICSSDAEANDYNECTIDTCNFDSCPNVPLNTSITACNPAYSDGCCPEGCDSSNDADCVGDTTPPTVSFENPLDGETITANPYTINVSATDPESGIEKVEFYIGGLSNLVGTQWVGSDGLYSLPIDSESCNGCNNFFAIAYNWEGLTAQASVDAVIDIPTSAAPFNVNVVSPAEGSTFGSGTTFSVTVHAEDDVDLVSVSLFSVDNGFINEALLTGDSNISINVTFGVSANSLAYLEEAITSYASKTSGFKLPFIPVAWAAEDDNCTTTTNTYWDNIYAVAYDNENFSTLSPQISLGRTVTSTTCIPTVPSGA